VHSRVSAQRVDTCFQVAELNHLVKETPKVRFFSTQSLFRQWLAKNHARSAELWVGFHKKNSGKKSISYAEALDEALCFGWIDGVRKSVDESSYTIRFTPRKSKSIWSRVNTKRAEELSKLGRMKPSGREAFALRDPQRSGIYSFETAARKLAEVYETKFRAKKRAWEYFQNQPPGYRKLATFWVMSAKKDETRLRRLEQLISDSAEARRLGIIAGKAK
jgi:uncharacterized protein YdeI (YjbR/CyaY-like superfamily)